MLALDALWLSSTLKRFYAPRLAPLLAPAPRLAPAACFYAIYALGVAVFVALPMTRSGAGGAKTFFHGALLGLVAYATYDLTNQATLRSWPLAVTLVDLTWGAVLTGLVSLAACAVTRRLG